MQGGQLESETTAPATAPALAEETGAETEQRLNTPEVGQLPRAQRCQDFYFLGFFYLDALFYLACTRH
jgi:hypothetical protein